MKYERVWIGFGFSLLIGLSVYSALSPKPKLADHKVLNISPAVSAISKPQSSSQSLTSLVKAPRLQPQDKLTPTDDIDNGCLNFWTEIQKLDLEMASFPVKLDRLPKPIDCQAYPKELEAAQTMYQSKCSKFMESIPNFKSEKDWQSEMGECQSSIFLLRSGISSWQTSEQNLSEISDLKILTDRLAFSITKLYQPTPETSELAATGERILEIEPKLYGAAKAVVIAETVKAMQDESHRGDAQYWKRLEPHYNRALELNSSDPELGEVARLIRTHGYDPEIVKREAEETISRQPNSSEAYHSLAYAKWKLGDKDGAYRALQRAIDLNGKDQSLKEAWNTIHQPNANKDSFKLEVKLGLRFDSIVQ